MIIFAIDDETAILSELHHSIEEARPKPKFMISDLLPKR